MIQMRTKKLYTSLIKDVIIELNHSMLQLDIYERDACYGGQTATTAAGDKLKDFAWQCCSGQKVTKLDT